MALKTLPPAAQKLIRAERQAAAMKAEQAFSQTLAPADPESPDEVQAQKEASEAWSDLYAQAVQYIPVRKALIEAVIGNVPDHQGKGKKAGHAIVTDTIDTALWLPRPWGQTPAPLRAAGPAKLLKAIRAAGADTTQVYLDLCTKLNPAEPAPEEPAVNVTSKQITDLARRLAPGQGVEWKSAPADVRAALRDLAREQLVAA